MEAAVLMPDVRAELEVQKLQELVRKLERQNEQLRSRANIAPPAPVCLLASPCCMPSPAPNLACQYFPQDDPFPYFQPHNDNDDEEEEEDDDDEDAFSSCEPRTLLDQLEILDLETMFPISEESDETWLYVSARSQWSGGGPSALQWCRHVLDQQRTDVDFTRHTLNQRLESVNRWRSGFSSPCSPAFPRARVVGVSPLCTSSPSPKPCTLNSSSTSSERAASCIPVYHHQQHSLRTERTFPHHSANRSRGVRRRPVSQLSADGDLSVSELDEDVILGYKLQDLTDVEVMARLQEESLRQEFATTSSSSGNDRRSSSFSFQFGQRGELHPDEDEEEEDDEDYGQLPPPPPRLSRVGPFQRGLTHSHTFSSIRDWTSNSSSPNSPQYPSISPFQPQVTTNTCVSSSEQPTLRNSSDKLRRSMPNLLRTPSMTSVPIPANQIAASPSLRNSQSFDSSSALGRLQSCIPSPGQLQNRVQSVGNFSSRQPLKATAYVSPTIKGPSPMTSSASLQSLSTSGIPQASKASSSQIPARSGLPRPASFIATSSTPRSKLATPARSLLTPPKSLSTLSALRDGGWRDGCY